MVLRFMKEIDIEQKIDGIVNTVLRDYEGGKNIDAISIDNNPDRAEIIEIVENLFKIVFPGYFKGRAFKIYNPKHSFAVTIEDIFYHLNKQVNKALDFCTLRGVMNEEDRRVESYRICREFFNRIPMIREYIETDLLAFYDGDPAAGCLEEIILAYPGLMAITIYRMAHELYLLKVPVIPRLMTEYAHSEDRNRYTSGSNIEKYFFIDHGTGIVIGETAVIGKNVKIYQGVTIGALSTRGGQKLVR